jgi:hypothetical protein
VPNIRLFATELLLPQRGSYMFVKEQAGITGARSAA